MQGGGGGVVELARRAAEAARTEPPARRSRKEKMQVGGGGGGGGGGIGGLLELARRAAAASKTEPAARLAALQPVRKYRGVQRRHRRHSALIWHTPTARLLYLGLYVTPEEAAYAFDAAARVLRGRTAKPNFPEPTLPEPEGVSTDLVLALPAPAAAPAHRSQHQQQPAADQQQASFANWVVPASSSASAGVALAEAPALFQPQQQLQKVPVTLSPFTQFFHLSGYPATAAAAAAAAGSIAAADADANPPATATASAVPGAFVLTPQNVQIMPPASTDPASSALSSTDPVVDTSLSLSLSGSAAAAHGVSGGQTLLGDNFTVVIDVDDDSDGPGGAQ